MVETTLRIMVDVWMGQRALSEAMAHGEIRLQGTSQLTVPSRAGCCSAHSQRRPCRAAMRLPLPSERGHARVTSNYSGKSMRAPCDAPVEPDGSAENRPILSLKLSLLSSIWRRRT